MFAIEKAWGSGFERLWFTRVLLGEKSHSYTRVSRIQGPLWESGAPRQCLADHDRCFSGMSGCIS